MGPSQKIWFRSMKLITHSCHFFYIFVWHRLLRIRFWNSIFKEQFTCKCGNNVWNRLVGSLLEPFGWLFVWTFLVTLYLNPFGRLSLFVPFWFALRVKPFVWLLVWTLLADSVFKPFWFALHLYLLVGSLFSPFNWKLFHLFDAHFVWPAWFEIS